MLRSFTSLLTKTLLTAAIVCATVGAGVAAQRGGGARAECPMSRLHDCCKRARQKRGAQSVTPLRLCCIANNPQPAPTGTSYTFQPSPGASSDPRPASTAATVAHAPEHAREYAPPFQLAHAPPAYIRHAAFLI